MSLIPSLAPTARRAAPFVGLRTFRQDRLGMLARFAGEVGDIGMVRLGPRSVTLVNAPRYAHAVLVEQADHFRKGPGLRIHTRPVLGNGLLTSDDDVHRRQRRLVAPAFRHSRVTAYAEVMTAYAEVARRGWRDGAAIDLHQAMMRLTLGIAGKTLFDADVLAEADALGAALTEAMRYASAQMASLVHVPLTWPTPRNRRVRRAIARLDATIHRMIAERRASGEDKGDFLSMLLLARDEDGAVMDDRQVRDEAMTIFLAGHETTANALTWTWYLLTRHPGVYERLQREADDVLRGRTPTVDDLPRLPYTLQVIKESMRLYPPAYALVREATDEVQLGDHHLRPGALLLVSLYTMHRRPDLFPDPERFDPDRFTPEAEERLPRNAYLPFGAGPRVCIGNGFAMLELRLVLAALAQRVTFSLLPGQRIAAEPLITLRPRYPVMMTVQRR